MDYSASFNMDHLRITLAGLHLINNVLRNTTGTRTALILYPIYNYKSELLEPSQYIFDFNASCRGYMESFQSLIGSRTKRSYSTRAYEALSFLAKEGTINSTRDTAVVTVTDGYSDPREIRIQKINESTSNIYHRSAKTMFFGAGICAVSGDNELTKKWIYEEIEALARCEEDHMYRQESNGASDKGFLHFIGGIAKLLVKNNIVSPTKGKFATSSDDAHIILL